MSKKKRLEEKRQKRILKNSKATTGGRTQFEVDHDRILYSSGLRRLNGITQVESGDAGRQFHNRHTHSSKVAQIAHRIAQQIERGGSNRKGLTGYIQDLGGLDPEVARTAGLAHDLGTPPFGHHGEQVLDCLVRKGGDSDGFEANAQTFRVVSKLATHKEMGKHAGLNLTRATLRSVLKYPWLASDFKSKKSKKWGAYEVDKNAFDYAMKLKVKGYSREDTRSRCSLEAEVMDWADDVANAVHDVEDFYRVGLIPLDRIRIDGDYSEELFNEIVGDKDKKNNLRVAWGELETKFPKQPFDDSRLARADIYTFRSDLIGELTAGFFFLDANDGHKLVWREKKAANKVFLLKRLVRYLILNGKELENKRAGERRIVEGVFEDCSSAIIKGKSRFMGIELPQGENTSHERIIADFISSRTENEMRKMHLALRGFS